MRAFPAFSRPNLTKIAFRCKIWPLLCPFCAFSGYTRGVQIAFAQIAIFRRRKKCNETQFLSDLRFIGGLHTLRPGFAGRARGQRFAELRMDSSFPLMPMIRKWRAPSTTAACPKVFLLAEFPRWLWLSRTFWTAKRAALPLIRLSEGHAPTPRPDKWQPSVWTFCSVSTTAGRAGLPGSRK